MTAPLTGTYTCGRVTITVTLTPDLARPRLPSYRVDTKAHLADSPAVTCCPPGFTLPRDTRKSDTDHLQAAVGTALLLLWNSENNTQWGPGPTSLERADGQLVVRSVP